MFVSYEYATKGGINMSKNKIEAQMVLNKMSKDDVSKMLGIHAATLYRKLSGKTEFTAKEIKTLSQELHIANISDVFFDV